MRRAHQIPQLPPHQPSFSLRMLSRHQLVPGAHPLFLIRTHQNQMKILNLRSCSGTSFGAGTAPACRRIRQWETTVSTGAGSLKCPSCAKSRRAFRQEETRSLPRASRNLKCRQTHAARRVRDFSPERSLPLTTARFAGSETIALIVPDLFRTLTVYRNRGQITSPICGVWAGLACSLGKAEVVKTWKPVMKAQNEPATRLRA